MNRHSLTFLIFAVFGLLPAPPAALAHAHLERAAPAAGSTVASAPNEVVLWFTSNIEPAFSTIEVRTMSGVAMQASKAAADPK